MPTSLLLTSSFAAPVIALFRCTPNLQHATAQNFDVHPHAQNVPRLLVVVIAGGTAPVYTALRGFWRMISEKVAVDGVVVYLVGYNPSLTAPTLHKGTLVFPGTDSCIPGVLHESLDAVNYIYHNKLPGHDAKHVLRTNLSSFWNFKGLLNWLATKPSNNFVSALVGVYGGAKFPSGAGYVLSRDLWMWILDNRSKLNHRASDDVAVGELLATKSLEIDPMRRQDFVGPAEVPSTFSGDYFHWRVKSSMQTQDIAIFSSLFLSWYGPDTQMAVEST
jgi:hypothetical protein